MRGQPAPLALTPSGVARSQLILAAGLATAASILAAWLLIWLIFFQTHLRLLAFSSDDADGTLPIGLAFQRADARDAAARSQGAGEWKPLPTADPKALVATVREYLDKRRGQTSVVLIAAPALGSFGAESAEMVLPPVDLLRHVVRDEALRGSSLRDLIAVFKAAKGQRLLILDIGRARADTDAGAFGDDPMAELAQLAQPPDPAHEAESAAWHRDWDGFAILAASAPGQWTWASDLDGRSVFGHFVADGLRRGGEVGTLLRSVPAQVASWVYTQRGGAVQTPIVLGDHDLAFTLPIRRDRLSLEPDPRQGDQARRTRDWLLRHYQHHASYERTGLPGLDPLAWREYRRAWLAAERLFRAGQINACQQMLAEADSREALFKTPGDRDWPSLELGLQVTNDPDRLKALVAAREALAAPASESRAGDDYAEGQPHRYGRTFAEALRASGGQPDPARTTLAESVARLRALAERAATLAPAGHPWADLLVDRAGAKRREATDLLHSTAASGPVAGLIHEAETGYNDALTLARAINLTAQVVADLPFLGAWAVRRGDPSRDRTREVARRVQTLARSLDTGRRDLGEPPVARIAAEADALTQEYAALRKTFDRAADLAVQSPSWRDIDDVLAVPTIRPDLREALIGRSIDPALVVALRPLPPLESRGTTGTGTTAGGAGESAAMGLVRQGIGSGVTVNDLGRQGLNVLGDQSRDLDLIGPAPEIRFDPTFAQYQGDLAVLEWSLLTAGGLTHKPSLESLLHPPIGRGGIARAARAARARLLAQAPAPAGDDSAGLAAFERARAVLPAPDADATGGDLGDAGSARWGRFLVRMADILREDGDARLAGRYLEALPDRERDGEAARRVAEGVKALARPIVLRAEAGGPTTLDGSVPASPVVVTVQAPAGSPRGRASLLLGDPGRVRLHSDGPAELISVGQAIPATRRVEVRRAEPLAEVAQRATLAPILVFRGRRVDAAPVLFDLPIVRSDFRVKFITPMVVIHQREMKHKYFIPERLVVDQFSRNDGTYTFYQRAETTLHAIVTYAPTDRDQLPTRRIKVSATFDGNPLPVALIDAKAPNPAADKDPKAPSTSHEIRQGPGQDLTFRIGPIDTSDPHFRPQPGGSDFRFEVRDQGDPTIVYQSEVRFHEVDPAAHFEVVARRVTPTEVDVTVRRGEADPIATIVGVAVFIAGGAPTLESIVHEQNNRLNKANADILMAGGRIENKAVLPHGERATFRFRVDPAENLVIRAEVINTPPRPPWPLVVAPDKLPAAVVPRPRAVPEPAAPNPAAPTATNPTPPNP